MQIPLDWARKWALYAPSKVAFKEYESGKTLTFQELDEWGNRAARWLLEELGLVKGDRIAVLAENCLAYPVLFSACQKSGCILVPLNYRLSSKEIDFLLQDSKPKLLLHQADFSPKIPSKYRSALNTHVLDDLFRLLTGVGPGFRGRRHFSPPSPSDPIFILYTSGSTGWPKGVLYTHAMLHWNSVNTSFSILVNTESRTVNCMPPFHTGGWNVLLTPFMHHGGYTCLLKKFDAETVLQALGTERATDFMGVPTMLRRMTEADAFETVDLSSLHYILAGGEPMPIPAIQTWNRKGVPIRQGYGMTEAGPNLTSLHHEDAISKAGSIGRPNFFVETKIVDESGQACPPNVAGELLIRGPMVTPGYWGNETATREAIVDGWLHTGDLVKATAEGYLYVVDRIKNMFISGGENVYPAEVERALLAHEAISEAVVVGVPDARWGQVGKAYLVLKQGMALDHTQVREHCLKHLAKYKIPKHYKKVDSLPKGDTGKIDRKKVVKI